ncbi:MAG: amidohydrolase [bacterium]|nr:amidohydrolase [bacterium]
MKNIIAAIIVLFSCSLLLSAQFDFDAHFKKRTKELYPEAVKIRRHLHQYPEPCYHEKETSAYIAKYLEECGLEVKTGFAGTGLKAILKGCKEKPVIGIRSDMDALPIPEETGFEFQSKNKGYMHACGHDGHMTNVLISAKILSEIKDKIPGTIVFIFQPCEEGAPGGGPSGAAKMVEDKVLENPKIDAMLGLHVLPGYPAGTIALKSGPMMANVASVFITINGKSSHGAFPHQGIDAIYVATLAVQHFQSLISRSKDPKEQAVITIGKICGGVRLNVIAEKVQMEGTVRSFSFETEDGIKEGMEKVLKGLSVITGITYDFQFKKVSKYVKNDAKLTAMLTPLFKKLLGENNVKVTDPLTIGEDFAIYSHKIPSLFLFLGSGMEGKLHSPTFAVDEKIFLYAPMLFSSAAVELLNKL